MEGMNIYKTQIKQICMNLWQNMWNTNQLTLFNTLWLIYWYLKDFDLFLIIFKNDKL